MKTLKIILMCVTIFSLIGLNSNYEVSSIGELEVLKKDGTSVFHFWTSDPVMIPTTYNEKSEEFRGVWVATVYNLNMPAYSNETQYKTAFQDLVNEMLADNLNAMVFQVRPQSDAFHDSAYAPWSRWLTGVEGGDPGWDIVQYMIDTCHANDIEFHAWMNPYRVANSSASESTVLGALHSENFARQNPALVVAGNMDSHGRYPYILNPGEPAVKTYIRDVVTEMYTMYDIDGIHFDDYFYPYSGISSDTATWNTYKEEGETIEDFRRENVNDVIREIKEDIDAHNLANGTEVKFGVSPFGLWGSGIEGYADYLPGGSNTGPTNMTSYIDQYADSKKWVEEEWLHYICPQVYWEFTHTTAPYADVVDWWASVARGTSVDLIIGQAISSADLYDWDDDEIADQLLYNQKHPEIIGTMLYSASYLNTVNMNNVVTNYWTTMPTNLWPTSNVASPDISITGTRDGDSYTSDVIVTLSSTEDIYYKIDSGEWILYTTPLVFVNGNQAVYAKAINDSLEESLITSVNINIVKENADIPVISIFGDQIGDNYVLNSVITITATETIWVAINHGSVGDWVLYTEPIILDDAGSYYIRAKTIDGSLVESAEDVLSLNIIPLCYTDPVINISGIGTESTYQNATVIITSDSPVVSYKINDGDWTTYTTSLDFSTEGTYTVYYRNNDECLTQFSETFSIDQTNPIDPVMNISGTFDGIYYTDEISVELTTIDPLNTIIYRIHNGASWTSWEEYTSEFDIIFNSTYYVEFYTIDQALNESAIVEERIKVNIPPSEDNIFVIRDGNTVNHYDTSTPVELPGTYTEVTEEIRAVWVATVVNIDIGLHYSEADYKSKIILMLDTIEANNFNVIFFQVRPMNDAFYDSDYAPWSRYLTGIEGQDPGWDVLGFLIEESHKRGIEFHAWLNPYRVSTGTADKDAQLALLHDDNFAKQNPDFVMVDNSGKLILNPGESQVQAYIKNVISELIAKYDLDGIHFDDYFYSYNGMNDSEDSETYNLNKSVGQSLDDWRRENINTIVEDIYNIIETHNTGHNTHIRFGISPFGIWSSGGVDGSNTSPYALQSYKDQYADSKKWVEEGWVHYILPQLYWEFDHSAAPFADLVDWWAELCESSGVDLIIGQGFYRYDDDSWDDDDELLEQLRYMSQYDSIIGSSLFSYRTLNSSDKEVVQAIERLNNYYWTEYVTFPWESEIEKYVDPICAINQTLIDGECVDNTPVCTNDQTLIDGECVDDSPAVCTDDQTLIDGECVDNTPVCESGYELEGDECVQVAKVKTGCFSAISYRSSFVVLIGAFGGAIFYFIRKFLG